MAADTGLPFASLPGLGNEEIPGFPVDRCPEELPDLSKHFSITADVLKEEPGLYNAMRSRQTPMGVTFAKCIKTGMDNRGHPMIKTLGAVAGDADCYDTFQPFFDKLVASCYGQEVLERPHLQAPKRFVPDVALADPSYVVSSHLRVSRNIQGLRFVPSMPRAERVEVERMLVKALLSNGLVAGDYFPLVGSQTYPLKPGGMHPKEEQLLMQCGRLFREPDSPAVLCTGGGRHWPDGRGVFTNQDRTWTAWINEEEHLKLMADRQDGQVCQMLADMVPLLSVLERLSGGFAKSDRLGYLNSSPSNIGTAMTASMVVRLPLLKSMKKELGNWCKSKDLVARGALDEQGLRVEGLVELSHRQKLGIREEDLVKELVQRVSELIRAEQCMERGMTVEAAFDAVVPRELTPIGADDQEYQAVDAWAHAGDQLGELLKGFVTEASLEEVKVRLGQALLASSLSGSLQMAKASLKAVETPFELLPSVGNLMLPLPEESASPCKPVEAAPIPFKYLPSVGSLLLPLPLPLRNLEEEELAKQKAEAAARIQAIQRGRAQRAEAKAKAQAKAKAKAKAPSQEEMEQRKALLRNALEGALEDGTLERVLSEASWEMEPNSAQDKDVAMERLRQKLAADLMVAADDGRLEQILARPQAEQMELLRKRMAASMLAAAEDGRLESALSVEQRRQDIERMRKGVGASILAAAEDGRLEQVLVTSEKKMQHTEQVRQKAAATLLAAAEDGMLEQVLESQRKASEQKNLERERVRLKAGASLLAAAENGRLEQVLSSEQQKSEQKKLERERVRLKAGASLLAAAENGRLEQVLASEQQKSEQKKLDRERVRLKAGASLLAAAESGRLEQVLTSEQKKKDVERVRMKAGASLLAAAESGRLEQALDAAQKKKDLERVRKATGASLLAAAESGRLEEVLTEKGRELELERVRKKIADGLLLAADDGSLEEALSRTMQKGNDKKMEDIRSRMAASLLEAVENGSLEQAFQESGHALKGQEAFQDTASTALTGLPSDMQRTNVVALANQTAKSHLVGMRQEAPQGAAAVQRALMQYERRIGSLTAAVKQAERGVMERIAEANSLEVALAEAQAKLRMVKRDSDSQRKLLEAEEMRALQLQDSQRQLLDELDFACLKQRHAQLELDLTSNPYTIPEVTNQ